MHVSNNRYKMSIYLFGPWRKTISRTQAGFDMCDRYLVIVPHKTRGNGRRRIALHYNSIGRIVLNPRRQRGQDTTSHVSLSLIALHDVQVNVRDDLKEAQHLIEHLSMLPRHANPNIKIVPSGLNGLDDRSQLDCLWPCAKSKEDPLGFHIGSKRKMPGDRSVRGLVENSRTRCSHHRNPRHAPAPQMKSDCEAHGRST